MAKVSINTYYKTALDLHKSGKLKEARKIYLEILKLMPNHLDSLLMVGQTWYQEQNFDKALAYFDRGLDYQSSNTEFLIQKGRVLIKLRKHNDAKVLFEELTKTNQSNSHVLFHAARNLKEMGQFQSALKLYQRVIQLEPGHKQALNNLANLYQQMYAFDESMKYYDQLLAIDPYFSMAFSNKAGLLQKMGRLDEAEQLYQRSLELDNNNSLAFYNIGVIHNRRFDHEKALQWIEKSLSLAPNNHKYLSTYASTLNNLGQKQKAVQLLQKLIKSGTDNEEPYLKLSKIYLADHKLDQVLKLLEPYVQRNRYCHEGVCLLGIVYDLKNDLLTAEKYLTQVEKHPEYSLRANMVLQLLYSKMGRMDKYDEMMERVNSLLHQFIQSDRQDNEIPVYNLIYYPYDLKLAADVTRKFSQGLINSIKPLRNRLNFKYQSKKDRIRVGYISPYFKNHPAGKLIQGVLKHHNRNQFEVFGYAINCRNDQVNSEVRPLLDHYREIGNLKSKEAAEIINNDGIQILVSLAGYNYGMNSEIPALRPAPIQVVCMDCHETMQTDYYDYMFKDEVVVTESNRPHFSESLAFLPPSHFFTTEMVPSAKEVTRADYDLPENAFVFGCLNHPRKLNPQAVRAWSEILKQVPDSILWLYDAGIDLFKTNILEAFLNEGIESARIRFCGREKPGDHIRRMELIDLFLDTSIYNGHTTCLEALWMSVPVLTLKGFSISSRLCSSFIEAIDIKEMVCETSDAYIQKAITLAQDEEMFVAIKKRFSEARRNSKFFDPRHLTRNIEAAYIKMWEKHERGETRSDFKVLSDGSF
ncbi:tetratricopeptide repeat protein [Ekhidna sp.]|uniref:O-linked N-acetylglucosamine transferase family protein n=1 Tax=Ekhidna sp. TaxID=2608089 RepID=UPI003CCC1E2D